MTEPAVLDRPIVLLGDEPAEPTLSSAPRALATTPTPADLLQMAVQQGADLDRLERLMALQERWESNEARKAFNQAMSSFKAEPLTIFKRKQVGYTTKDNEFVGYKHAELCDVTDAVGPAMARHGLSYRWDIKQEAGRINVSCIVTHRLGHAESVTMDAAPDNSGKKNAIQQIASAVSYLQRYTLLAVTGMSTKGMDNDGADADGDDSGTEGTGDADHRGGPKARTEAEFNENLPAWRKVIESGRKTVPDLIAMLETKQPLTEPQKATLRAVKPT